MLYEWSNALWGVWGNMRQRREENQYRVYWWAVCYGQPEFNPQRKLRDCGTHLGIVPLKCKEAEVLIHQLPFPIGGGWLLGCSFSGTSSLATGTMRSLIQRTSSAETQEAFWVQVNSAGRPRVDEGYEESTTSWATTNQASSLDGWEKGKRELK